MAKLSLDALRELASPGSSNNNVDAAPAWRAQPSAGVRSLPDRKSLSETANHYRGLDGGTQREPAPLVDESDFDDREVRTAEGTLRKAVLRSKSGDIIAEQG